MAKEDLKSELATSRAQSKGYYDSAKNETTNNKGDETALSDPNYNPKGTKSVLRSGNRDAGEQGLKPFKVKSGIGPIPVKKLQDTMEVVRYTDPSNLDPVDFRIDTSTESIWATQVQIAHLFETNQQNISYHLQNVFSEGELEEESNTKKIGIAHSAKPVRVYSLDAVISVGYRVNSKAATRFRQWANRTLKAYIEQGYVINERALRDSPEKLNKLAAQVRSLRAEEKQVYAKVLECFKIGAADYDPTSKVVRKFYALLQDKFHHAVTGQTSSKLVMDRADHSEENMGLQSISGKEPKTAEVVVGKNYLRTDELYRLHLLSEQFLLYAETTALAGKKMTMEGLHRKLDGLLAVNEYEVFEGYKDYIKDEAIRHAKAELELYRVRKTIEGRGLEFSEEAFSFGEYDEILRAA